MVPNWRNDRQFFNTYSPNNSFIGFHPTIALSDIVKDIKNGSSERIKNEKIFPEFTFR